MDKRAVERTTLGSGDHIHILLRRVLCTCLWKRKQEEGKEMDRKWEKVVLLFDNGELQGTLDPIHSYLQEHT